MVSPLALGTMTFGTPRWGTPDRALDGSLRWLGTDHVDLYWLHVWDTATPAEEMLQTLGDLVRAGKVRYFGLSDMPAWYAAKMATLAAAHGVPGLVAVQVNYSLVERRVEREHLPAAREFGMGVTPWGPLGAGFLADKYRRDGAGASGTGRLTGPNPCGARLFTDRNWRVLDALRGVAERLGRPPAEVALAWVSGRPGVTAPIVGATGVEQLCGHLASLGLRLPPDEPRTLDEASALDPAFPYPR